MNSRTKNALAHMEKTGCSAYAAAHKFGITPATVYAAMTKPRCPHCGNYIKDDKPAAKPAKTDSLLDL